VSKKGRCRTYNLLGKCIDWEKEDGGDMRMNTTRCKRLIKKHHEVKKQLNEVLDAFKKGKVKVRVPEEMIDETKE